MLTVAKMDQVLGEDGTILSEDYAKKQEQFLSHFLEFAQKLS